MIRPPQLVDTHAHLDDRRLKGRLAEVLRTAGDAGVVQVIAIATTALDAESVVAMASENPGVFASVGIHPNEAVDADGGDWDRVRELAGRPKVVALGETGLDRHWDRTPFDLQRDYFGRHLELASQLDLPVVIHGRDCHADIVGQLADLGRPVRGVAHSFTGTKEQARELLDLGLYISFAGMLTFANKGLDALREAAAFVPADRLLVETDSPYLSPHPHRGKDNEPARVVVTAAKLAEIRGVTLGDLAEATTSNARRLFSLLRAPIISPA